MTPQELKNSILQLAIQGKLVEQRPEEGNAEELYKKIQAEKQELVKAGKIKKEKALPEIAEDEIPFEIPENWMWVRLGDIGYTNIGLTYSPKDISSEGTIVLRSSNIQNGKIDYNDIVRVKLDIPESKTCIKGDILICARNGSKKLVGKAALIDADGMSFGAFMAIFRSQCNQYILHVINSIYFRNSLLGETGTTTINQITQNTLKNAPIPLPPLSEQRRIVSKLDELLPLCDRYGESWSRLEELNKRFPGEMRRSLLQMAIQGKLVEQRHEEGNAQELYKKIQAEKQELIKAGKIKKDKALPEIAEEEIPFEIPENWMWVRLGELTYNLGQKRPTERFCYVDVGSIDNKRHKLNESETIVEAPNASSRARKIVQYGDVIFATVRPYLQNICIIDHEFSYEPIVSTAFAVMSCPEGLFNKYLYYSLLSPEFTQYANSSDKSKGVAYPAIGEKDFFKGIIPLPPLSEQRRIVSRLEELLPLCDRLK